MEKINIAEILKNCEKGMELYSPIFGELKFNEVNAINNRILVVQQNDYIAEFESDGRLINCKNGECLLFPSKGKTTWEGFVPPCKFKDGDIIVGQNCACSYITIFRKFRDDTSFSHHACLTSFGKFKVDDFSDIANLRLATEEEKQKLFQAIKNNGYNWNPDTKTLERLVEPSEGTLVQIDFTRELRIADEVEVILGDYEFVLKDGKTYFVKKKPQYPKTYEECCRIVNANPCVRLIYDLSNGQKYSYDVDNLQHYENIRKLLICRDAYWKIAGEEMGLDKPWKPDWNNVSNKHCIYFVSGEIWLTECQTRQCTLAFPTAEMRDAFYDNFKELIDKCKEQL